jgi:hypothetical protein
MRDGTVLDVGRALGGRLGGVWSACLFSSISVHATAMEIERHGEISNHDLLTTVDDLNESMDCELGILISVYIITCHPAERRRT